MKRNEIKNYPLYKRTRRHARIRTRVIGDAETPRLSIFRSNRFIYAQIIDDQEAKTLASASDVKIEKGTKIERAKAVGLMIADAGKKAKVTKVVFDRGGFLYTGRIKAFADSAREGGLEF